GHGIGGPVDAGEEEEVVRVRGELTRRLSRGREPRRRERPRRVGKEAGANDALDGTDEEAEDGLLVGRPRRALGHALQKRERDGRPGRPTQKRAAAREQTAGAGL